MEIWLGQLLHVSRQSLHTIIREAYITVTEGECNLIEILEELPAQVGILALQMIWTRDSESALIQARHDRKIMPEVNNRFLDMLNQLVSDSQYYSTSTPRCLSRRVSSCRLTKPHEI